MKSAPGAGVVIGIDCSTTAVKAIAWDETGCEIAAGRAGLSIHSPEPGQFEQPAEDWWIAFCSAVRQVIHQIDPSRVQAVAIAHQRETFVPVDSDLQPLRPALLWLDQRGSALLPDLTGKFDSAAFHHRTGKPLTANLAPSKIEWLRLHESEVFARTRYYLDTHAYLVARLSGRALTSTASADPLGLYDLRGQCWDSKVLAALHLDAAQMPEALPPGSILAQVSAAAAEQTGLQRGTPVVAGLGDGQAAAFGMDVTRPGEMSLSLGTSVIGGCFSSRFETSPAFRTMTGARNTFLFETVILSGTQILNWITQDLLGAADPNRLLDELDAAAAEIPAGAEGLVLLPYWSGAMNPHWDASASGCMIGLRPHHRPVHIYRAALEGIAFELRLHLEGLEAVLPSPVEEMLISGGGARSRIWPQILSDVCGKTVSRKAETEAAALGAALVAAEAVGLFPSAASPAEQSGPSLARIEPNPDAHNAYTHIYESCYRTLYPALRLSMRALHA
jgi:xylulokinase